MPSIPHALLLFNIFTAFSIPSTPIFRLENIYYHLIPSFHIQYGLHLYMYYMYYIPNLYDIDISLIYIWVIIQGTEFTGQNI